MNPYITLKTLIIFVLLSWQLSAQDNPDQLVEQFFETFEKEGSSVALDEMYSSNKWVKKSTDAIMNLKNQMANLTEDYIGKYYGYELIVEKKLSNSYVLKSYLVRFDRQPLRFTFQYYKPDQEWMIYSFQFDDSLDEEIEESAKLYFLDSEN